MGSAILNPVDILGVSIGDIHVAITSDDPSMNIGVPEATKRFLTDCVNHNDANATVTAVWGDLREPVAGDRIFDSGRLWQLYRQGSDYTFRFHSPIFGEHPYKQARFSEDFTSGEVTFHADYHDRDQVALPLEYPLDELMMTNLLARGRGIEIHSCGMRDLDGRGYLFVGHSGAGKTTTAQLWEKAGVLILSDDRVILRYLDGKVWMYGTPWHGEAELATSARTELTQIFFLGRGARNEMVPMREPDVVAQLFTRSFVPFYSPGGLDYSLSVLQQVARAVPCAELRFVPDERVVEFVREHAR
jgi:hypothetical protein